MSDKCGKVKGMTGYNVAFNVCYEHYYCEYMFTGVRPCAFVCTCGYV